jgi:hypothetical protein
MGDLVPVIVCESRPEGALLAGYLRECGVPAVVDADDMGGQNPAMAFAHEVTVLVHTADLSTAEEALDALEHSGDLGQPDGAWDEPPEHLAQLRAALKRSVTGVIAGLLFAPKFLEIFALFRAVGTLRTIMQSPHSTCSMKTQAIAAVLASAALNLWNWIGILVFLAAYNRP